MLKKASNAQELPYFALLAYRSTQTADGLPSKVAKQKKKKYYYDLNAKNLFVLSFEATVRVRQGSLNEWSSKCQVLKSTEFPRSYEIKTSRGTQCRRNKKDLLESPKKLNVQSDSDYSSLNALLVQGNPMVDEQTKTRTAKEWYVTRLGCVSKPPLRYTHKNGVHIGHMYTR